jgi:hypothetical protein
MHFISKLDLFGASIMEVVVVIHTPDVRQNEGIEIGEHCIVVLIQPTSRDEFLEDFHEASLVNHPVMTIMSHLQGEEDREEMTVRDIVLADGDY